jgi:hypothetical protein
MENRMVSRFKSFAWPVSLAAVLACSLAFAGCAGGKSASSSMSEASAGSEPARNQKLDDARRSAEEAEAKAHDLREEKNRNTAKTGN